MKKLFISFLPFILIFLFSIYVCQKLFNPLFYTSHDGEGHVIRLIEFDKSLKDGQFPVRLLSRVNYGLSYPFFNFNYPFVYYLGEFIYLLGFSFVSSFKALLFISILLGGIAIYFFVKRNFGVLPGMFSSFFYIFAPYTLLNIYVRADVAESLGLSFFILLLLSIDIYVNSNKSKLFLIVSWAGLILSHNITAAVGSLIGIMFFLVIVSNKKNKKNLFLGFIFSFSTALLLTAFFIIPVLIEAPKTKLIELTEDYRNFFPSLRELIYSPWGFGSYKEGLVMGKMSPQLGISHIFIFIVFIITIPFFLFKENEKKKLLLFFLALGIICFLMASSYSEFLWNYFYPLRIIQLPWRLMAYVVVSSCVLGAYVFYLIKNKTFKVIFLIFCLILLLYSSRNQIRVNMYIKFINPFEKSLIYGPSTTSKDEHMPIFAPRIFEAPLPGNLFASTSGGFKREVWKSNYHRFKLLLKENAEFRDNTSYFPGWEVFIDGEKVPNLYFKDEYYRLRVSVPAGRHIIESKFSETWYRLLADFISITIFSCIVVYAVIKCVLWLKQKKKNLKKYQKRLKTARNAR